MTKRSKSKKDDPPARTWGDEAALALKVIRRREAKPRTPNDPTYPLQEAKKTAVNALVYYSRQSEQLPFEVVELVAHLLKVPPEYQAITNERREEYWRAAEYIGNEVLKGRTDREKISSREVAGAVGVSKDTVRKWRKEYDFITYSLHFMWSKTLDLDWETYVRFRDAQRRGDDDEALKWLLNKQFARRP